MRKIRRIIVHHSAGPVSTTLEQIRAMHEASAKVGNRLAYHYFIGESGMVEIGQPLHVIGTHARGANRDSVGICVAGNNTEPAHRWNQDQWHGLARIVHALWVVLGPLGVYRHDQCGTTATACPGLTENEWERAMLSIQFDGATFPLGVRQA